MIKLITLDGEYPIFSPEVRMLSPLRKILERDKGKKSGKEYYDTGDHDGRKKSIATKELAFIYYFSDPRSPYVESYQDLDTRQEKIKTLLDLPNRWVRDALVEEAINFYLEEIKDDFDVRYLNANIIAAEKTIKYLEAVDYEKRDSKGNLLYKPEVIAKVQTTAGQVLEALKSLRERAFRKVSLSTKIRGGGDIGMFERPD